MSFTSVTDVKRAAKAHTCDECGHPINIGEPYRKWAGVFEGEFYDGKGHGECVAWASAVMNCDEGRASLKYGDPDCEDADEFEPAVRANPPSPLLRSRLPKRWLIAVDRILAGDGGEAVHQQTQMQPREAKPNEGMTS